MKNTKYAVLSIMSLIFICLFLVKTSTTVGSSSNEYRTILYTCTSGETIERCWYNGGGCDISGQWLCDSELWNE